MFKLSKGFTLIELIVVIAIIAILATIVIANVAGYIQKASIASLKSDLDQVARAEIAYYAQNGTYAGFCGNATNCTGGSPDFQTLCKAINSLGSLGTIYDYCFDSSCPSSNEWEWYVEIYPGGVRNVLCTDYSGAKTYYNSGSNCLCASGQGGW
ncbi:MAG: prepilin-type N-terminal cleavage/methylation domain-containing protein [Candidatus Staskawiczbacteria bacterium]|jgi:prepilin-type N-terminal cleavage/methylation domain-containing protein